MSTLHPDLVVEEFLIKNEPGYRLRVRSWKPSAPSNLNSIEFINECLRSDGTIAETSTYNFFLENRDILSLSDQLKLLIK
jgi:hypothetical protein